MQIFKHFKGKSFNYGPVLTVLLFIAVLLYGCHSLVVTRVNSTNIRLDSSLNIAPDPKMESVILPYRTKLMNDMEDVLCISKDALFGGRPESPLTNFCADLILQESDSICLKRYPEIRMSVSMVNRGGLRVPIPKGEVKVQNMFELMPFENEIVLLKLSGVEMLQFIDHIASRGGEGVAGMRLGIKDDKAFSPEIQGKPLDETKSYWLVTSDYIANGGDGFEILSSVKERVSTGVKFRDMFIGHLRSLGKKGITIEAKADGRIYNAK
ncbi:MAG TPA: 5'-nucleotidase C-terminal domain-containing protein [Prolixibacteraceae bacterium]|nr:5'-nucleotidase C-terminal domain-containing protein [Prolixibacteraceae bacterium]